MTTEDDFFDAAPCGLVLTDPDDVVVRANRTFTAWTGYPADLVIGRPFASFLTAGDQAFYATQYQDELWASPDVREIALAIARPDGSRLPIMLNASLIRDGDAASGVRIAVFDATRRQDFERETLAARRGAEASEAAVRMLQDAANRFLIARSETEFAAALADVLRSSMAASDTAVVLYDADGGFRTLHGGHLDGLLHAVRATRPDGPQVLGPDQLVLIGDIEEAYARSPEVGDLLRSARAAAFAAAPIGDGRNVIGAFACLFGRPRDFDRTLRDQLIALSRQAGLGYEAVHLQEQLQIVADRDALTGTASRAAIDRRIVQALERDHAAAAPTSLIFLDLDGFKTVNDRYGHRAGDLVLQTFAARIRDCIRDTDAVGRYGGDEFLVVCPGADADTADRVARRILDCFDEPIASLPAGVRVTASIGLVTAVAEDGELSAEDLIRRADSGMYVAKGDGKARIMRG